VLLLNNAERYCERVKYSLTYLRSASFNALYNPVRLLYENWKVSIQSLILRRIIRCALWLKNTVVPIFKSGDSEIPTNYRPISVLTYIHQGNCKSKFFRYDYRLHLQYCIAKDSCLFVINIYFILEIFSESLFVLSQSIVSVISQLNEFCHFSRLLSLWNKTASSVKSIVFIKFEFGKSFINNQWTVV